MSRHPTPQRSDRRSDSVAELLANAYKDAFVGSVIVEGHSGKLSALRLQDGDVVQASGAAFSSSLVRGALGMFLPPESLAFVEQHAATYQIDCFAAVAQLALLPPESLRAAREAVVVRGVENLARATSTHYRHRPGTGRLKDAVDLEPPLPTWTLVLAAAQANEQSHDAALLERLSTQPLTVAREARFKSSLTGPARAVVEALTREPRTLRALEELDLLPRAKLRSIVQAFWLTGHIMAVARPSRPVPSDSCPPSAREFQERALEDKVLEAWVLAEADQSRVEKASSFAVKAALAFPRNAKLQYYSACLHQRAQRPEEAKAAFSRVLQLDPHYDEARRELAKLMEQAAHPGLKRFFGKG